MCIFANFNWCWTQPQCCFHNFDVLPGLLGCPNFVFSMWSVRVRSLHKLASSRCENSFLCPCTCHRNQLDNVCNDIWLAHVLDICFINRFKKYTKQKISMHSFLSVFLGERGEVTFVALLMFLNLNSWVSIQVSHGNMFYLMALFFISQMRKIAHY